MDAIMCMIVSLRGGVRGSVSAGSLVVDDRVTTCGDSVCGGGMWLHGDRMGLCGDWVGEENMEVRG